MIRHSVKLLSGLVLGATWIAACGGKNTTEGMNDPLVMEASDETRSALGVTIWGVRAESGGTTVIRGYDASNSPIVEFRREARATDDMQSTVTTTVTGPGVHAKMKSRAESTLNYVNSPDNTASRKTDGTTNLGFQMFENSFANDPSARRIVDMLDRDAKAHPPHARDSGGKGLVKTSSLVEPTDAGLVTGTCISLTTDCATSLIALVGDGIDLVVKCAKMGQDGLLLLTCSGSGSCQSTGDQSISSDAQSCAEQARKAVTSTEDAVKSCTSSCGGNDGGTQGNSGNGGNSSGGGGNSSGGSDGGGGSSGGGQQGGGGSNGGGGNGGGGNGGGANNDAVARARQWVDAKMPYCQSAKDKPDMACGGTCTRTGSADNAEWNAYRSDCSGLISYAWGLPAPGRVTWEFAPKDTSVSEVVAPDQIQPGDALNKVPDGHIILFAGWNDKSTGEARIIEEADCGRVAEDHPTTLTVRGSSFLRNGVEYVPIRHR
ncbi:hypothetical protein LZC95_49180 [Pendulispora brunnea]|uniref:NlpC/P60 domain-containing protein n=1 Tax=Pendulispora brunnea TaxID=2905690 RepID=A0ABZ2K6V0_9BACT